MSNPATPEFIDIKLSRAITVSGTALSTLRMREPTVADQKIAQKSSQDPVDIETTLFANLCDLVPSDLNQLTMRDYKKLQDAHRVFTS